MKEYAQISLVECRQSYVPTESNLPEFDSPGNCQERRYLKGHVLNKPHL